MRKDVVVSNPSVFFLAKTFFKEIVGVERRQILNFNIFQNSGKYPFSGKAKEVKKRKQIDW